MIITTITHVEFAGHTSGHSSYYTGHGRGVMERADGPAEAARGFWIVVELTERRQS
jgi:hypothetical protein